MMKTQGISLTLALALLVSSTAALAQFRPPPMTEAERLTRQADGIKLDGSKALLSGNKSRAAERYKKASEIYANALKEDPGHVGAGEGFGECASALNDNESVVRLLTPVMAANPKAVNVAYYLGVALMKLDRPEEAVGYLELVSQNATVEHLVVHYYLGRHYLMTGRADAAQAALERYLRTRPEKLAANDHQVLALLGHAHLAARRGPQAKAAFETAQRGRAEALPLQMGIAASLELEGKEGESIALLEALSQRFPQSPEPRERLGWLMLAGDKLDRAALLADEAVRLGASTQTHHLAGEVALALGQPRAAEAHLQRALEYGPNFQPARFSLARAIQAQGRHQDAAALLEQAAKGGLDTPELWAALGSTYRRAGRYQDAIQTHRKVLAMLPDSPWGHVLLGADYYATGEWDPAIEAYTRALEVDPENATAKRWLAGALGHRARVLARQDQLDDAARVLRRAWDLDRTASMARSLSSVLLTQREYKEAAAVMERGVTLPGAGWQEHLLHGYALLGAGRAEPALEAFEAAARLTTDTAAQGDIYAGWALTKLELGDFDTAMSKLLETGKTGRAAQVAEQNLPLALVRRGLDKVRAGDADGASKDFDAIDKLKRGVDPEVVRLASFGRGLVAIEASQWNAARVHFRKAFAGRVAKWRYASSEVLADAYLEYRRGNIARSKQRLTQAKRQAATGQESFLVALHRGQLRREGELALAKGQVAPAERALRAALAEEPLNAWVQGNLATVAYRKGRHGDAVGEWEKVSAGVPEAHLNLGIDAQLRQKDMERAVLHYARYAATGGRRAREVREWRDRLMSLYGVSEPNVGAATATETVP